MEVRKMVEEREYGLGWELEFPPIQKLINQYSFKTP